MATLAPRFAQMEARINRACVRHLANASAVVGGTSLTGIYDALHADVLGMEASPPTLDVQLQDLGNVLPGHGTVVNVSGKGAFVVAAAQPDGAGWARLVLERTL